jgi:hypothetical protein
LPDTWMRLARLRRIPASSHAVEGEFDRSDAEFQGHTSDLVLIARRDKCDRCKNSRAHVYQRRATPVTGSRPPDLNAETGLAAQ